MKNVIRALNYFEFVLDLNGLDELITKNRVDYFKIQIEKAKQEIDEILNAKK